MEPTTQEAIVKSYPTLKQSFIYLLIMLAINVVVSVVIIGIAFVFTKNMVQSSATMLIGYVVVFLLSTLYGRRKMVNANPAFSKFQLKKVGPLVLVFSFFITLALIIIIDPIVNLIPMPDWLYRIFAQLLEDPDIVTIMMLSIAAPILEEVIFRGIILRGFLQNYSPKKAIIWSSVLFGLLHLNPWQFIPAVALGIFIGWIYWKTESLLPCIFIHFVANSSSVIVSLFVENVNATTQDLIGNNSLYFSLVAIAIFVVYFGVKQMSNYFSSSQKSINIEIE